MEKKFSLFISSYSELLSSIENVCSEEIISFVENYHEPLPESFIEKAISELKQGERKFDDAWHINDGKLFGMLPEYHREIEIIRLS